MRIHKQKTRLQRRGAHFLKIYISGLLVFGIMFVIGVKLIIGEKVAGPVLYAVVFMPALPLFVMGLYFRRLLLEDDEFHKGVVIRALLTGLAALLLILVPWVSMSSMIPELPRLEPLAVFVFFLVFFIALMHGHWKAGLFSKTDDYDPWREPEL